MQLFKSKEKPKTLNKKIGGLVKVIPKAQPTKKKIRYVQQGVSHQAIGTAGISFQKVSFGTSAFSVEVPEYMRRKR